MGSEFRKGGHSLKKALRIGLILISGILLGVMVFSTYKIVRDRVEHQQARKMDSEASDTYVRPAAASPTPRAYRQEVEEQQDFLDDEVSPLNSMYDLDKFFSDYPDAIAWIYCPDTKIDYGVVEAENNDYYLHRFYDGSYSVSGSLFADCCNARDFSDDNTVIYGHNMGDGSKFAGIMNYKLQSYFDQHPVLYLSTPEMNYRLELFAGFLTDADSEAYLYQFNSPEEFSAWQQRMISQSDFRADVTPGPEDRIVTLSTCSYEYYDARYVVMGKLVPIH